METTGEIVPLNQAVAESMFDEWCQLNGSDTGWASPEVDDDTRNTWIALADIAIATIEFDYLIVERGEVIRP